MGEVIYLNLRNSTRNSRAVSLGTLRHLAGMSADEFAAAIADEAGEPVPTFVYMAYEDGEPPPAAVLSAARRVAAHARPGSADDRVFHPVDRERLQRAGAPEPAPIIMLPSGGLAADVGEADARRVIAWVESTNTTDDAVGYFTQATTRLAEEHASAPPAALLAAAGQLHAMISALMEGGRQRQHQVRELMHTDAWLLAHICQMLGDIERDRDAVAYATASAALATEAGSGSAAVYSAQAQIARWRGRHTEAADLAAEGLRSAPPPHLRTLLAYQEANAAAAAKQRRRARAALRHADSLDDDSVSYSAWSCPPARRALYRLGVALNLGDASEALRLAGDVGSMWPDEQPLAVDDHVIPQACAHVIPQVLACTLFT